MLGGNICWPRKWHLSLADRVQRPLEYCRRSFPAAGRRRCRRTGRRPLGDQSFKHFASTPAAEVIQVAGEFTWRVRRGETNRVVDYVAPPLMLSRESTGNDLTWSQGLYVEPAVLAAAFKLSGKLPTPIGVFANQPNPWATPPAHLLLFWKLALLAIVLQLFFVFIASGKQLLRQDLSFRRAWPRKRWSRVNSRSATSRAKSLCAIRLARQQLDRPRDDAGQQGHRRRPGRRRANWLITTAAMTARAGPKAVGMTRSFSSISRPAPTILRSTRKWPRKSRCRCTTRLRSSPVAPVGQISSW
jgi:hypothetical protein